jgi:antitoxin (DNA-binding transcriptional repressor) of toxin-antitoxin stability system
LPTRNACGAFSVSRIFQARDDRACDPGELRREVGGNSVIGGPSPSLRSRAWPIPPRLALVGALGHRAELITHRHRIDFCVKLRACRRPYRHQIQSKGEPCAQILCLRTAQYSRSEMLIPRKRTLGPVAPSPETRAMSRLWLRANVRSCTRGWLIPCQHPVAHQLMTPETPDISLIST